jgi:hypothetical protein
VSNGSRLHGPGVDGRTSEARRFRDLVSLFAETAEDPKLAEFKLLASGKSLIGENSASAHLHAETLRARATRDRRF